LFLFKIFRKWNLFSRGARHLSNERSTLKKYEQLTFLDARLDSTTVEIRGFILIYGRNFYVDVASRVIQSTVQSRLSQLMWTEGTSDSQKLG
jgi:hypothetical protein